jgi:hypothetical protein
MPEKEDDASET